ncbi:MAG: cell division protein FtsZ [Oscillospiraceae bacterium]|nr:cell division protein FtsZ [Oscillospiraceae bacterium]
MIMVDNSGAELSEVIKVVGVGGGGGNAVNRMLEEGIKGVVYVAVNTDARALGSSKADTKVQIGVKLTGGKGAGARPNVGKDSAEENRDEIKAALAGADMVFITAGMGGGTGTGAAPIVASIAKEMGILTVGIVTKPFAFERDAKMKTAEAGIAELKQYVDSLIVIPNQALLDSVEEQLTIKQAMILADRTLMTGVKSIAELITVEGDINLDFADVRTIMENAGYAHMAVGHGSGKDKAADAAKQVISSPLLETSISGATRLLFNVACSEDVLLSEIDQAIELISDAADPSVETIFGQYTDPDMRDEMKITVIAAAFNNDSRPQPAAQTAFDPLLPNFDSDVEIVPSSSAKKEELPPSEDYSAFFNMINNH